MPNDFTRPNDGFRFLFGGMKTASRADALPVGKYPLAVNVRAYSDGTIQTRSGMSQLFQTSGGPVLDMRAYTGLQSVVARILAFNSIGSVVLDTGTAVGSLAGGPNFGAAMIPFRPNASPLPWMYIANGFDYQKFSAPSPTNVVTQQKAGIAEPQQACDATVASRSVTYLSLPAQTGVTPPTYVAGGTAGAISTTGTRISDAVLAIFPDPNGLLTSLQVTGASFTSGAVTAVHLTQNGVYPSSTPPSISFSGGGGSGAAAVAVMQYNPIFNFWRIQSIVVTNGGSGYVSAPAVAFSPIGSGPVFPHATAIIASASGTQQDYTREMVLTIGAPGATGIYIVEDVLPPLPSVLAIQSIQYYSGTTGKCVVVPAGIAPAAGTGGTSLYVKNVTAVLRRGSLVVIGSETCFVLSTSAGPDGTISFETTTTLTHTTADALSGVAAISVIAPASDFTVGNPITSATYASAVTTGIGTLTASAIVSSFGYQPDDYLHISLLVDNAANLNEMRIQFDVGDGTFTQNYYYYAIRPSDLTGALTAATPLTQLASAQEITQRAGIDAVNIEATDNQLASASSAQLYPGASQWTEIFIPIAELTRVGNIQSANLTNINSIQVLVNAAANLNMQFNGIYFSGQYQPDVGDVGAPYRYRVRPRSSLTGAVGNPSPDMRYDVTARRESVTVLLPSAAYDAQIDTWDIFRYGGTVTEWRFIGSTPSTNTMFSDNYDDSAAGAGDALDFDNFEPWPSVDTPNTGTATVVNGTLLIVTSTDPDILSYLPGTLIQLGGQNVYTLYNRPIGLGGTSYLIQLDENSGAGTNVPYIIQEPVIANQYLPYMFGPDALGTVFACGDSFRPGNVYFAKNYAPDSAPDSYNQEIVQPAEPLLGGEVLDGLAFVASSERWWALYPQPQDPSQRYSAVQQPYTRGLAAPYGHCTDGQTIYWWAKDGIWSSTKGSLTEDLYNLFPHEGIAGENITYGGKTVFAPSYNHANAFRLAYSLGYLYAIYLDSNSFYRCLVLDVKRGAWCVDEFAGPHGQSVGISAAYHVEQEAQVNGNTTLLAPYTGNLPTGIVAVQTPIANDINSPIAALLAVNELSGGDDRAPKQWGDFFVDSLPAAAPAGLSVTPFSLGAGVAAATIIPSSFSRVRSPASVGGVVVSDFMGLLFQWTDDYSQQNTPTRLFVWQPSFVVQPARAIAWTTFGTSFGLDGYMHIRQLSLAYVSTAAITVQVTSYDGQSPATITLPSTGGAYHKALFPIPANKGQIFKIAMTSSAPFQIFSEDSSVYVGGWGRTGPYAVPSKFGGSFVQPSPV